MSAEQQARHQQAAPYPLRLPPDVLLKLKEKAASNRRSLNNELTLRLEQSLKQEAQHATP
jgi:hypothetical protein